jgi:hypothetical protein
MQKLWVLCLLLPVAAFSQQRLHLTIFGGVANYQGDLQGKAFTLDQSNLALGLGVKYDLTPNFALRGGINYGTVEAADARNEAKLRFRNLSFVSRIVEGNLLVEYTLFNMEDRKISPYVFAGAAVYHFDPYAFDSVGRKVFLQPLSTEGQGLPQYPDRKPYKLTQFAIPFGAGVKFRINENTVLGYEIGLRKIFTDHLDDVSTTYVDPFVLAQERGLKAVEMSYRAGELNEGDPNYPAEGTIRGGSQYKDWYYFTGFTVYIGINSKNGSGGYGGRGRRGRQLDCPPRPVY